MTNEEELLHWLRKTLGPRVAINEDTVFMDDLGLAGLDVLIFFEEFAERFDIDMSSFSESNYDPIAMRVFDVWSRGKRVKSFGTRHLVAVIERKAWFDPA